MPRMKITVVDPPAYTPPYDHCLCAALAKRGLEVELATSHFRHGPVPEPEGYRRSECFYRRGPADSRIAKAVQHPIDMLRLARRMQHEQRGIVHFQWLPIPILDRQTITRFRLPRVLTAHDVLPRDVGPRRQRSAQRLFDYVDAVVVHSDHGRGRLVNELGVAAEKVHVIPHGTFEYMTRLPEGPIDPAAGPLDGRKVVLCLGLMRPYKGIDLLIEAFRSAPENAVLLLAGKPMMPIAPLRRRAQELGIADRVRFVPRFVTEPEIPAYFRRADLVVLPYREIEQSGVLSTALAFGVPLLLTSVGGFTEVGERYGAARIVPAGDARSLGNALADLLRNDAARAALSDAARRAAAGPYSWSRAAELTEELYRSLLDRASADRPGSTSRL
jgi:glycosyltransferase involved in cell wall biosynthesis